MTLRMLLAGLMLIPMVLFGQKEIVLQQRQKAKSTRKLPPDMRYEIKTRDSLYHCKILGQHDGILSIETERAEKKTVTVNGQPQVNTRFFKDTTEIPAQKIVYIQRDWFKSREWLKPAMVGTMLSMGAVLFLPFAAIGDGKEGVLDWCRMEAALLVFSLPQLFVGTRKTRYDMQNKWKFAP